MSKVNIMSFAIVCFALIDSKIMGRDETEDEPNSVESSTVEGSLGELKRKLLL